MFLQSLSTKEKKAFLALAYIVASVDGLHAKEEEMIAHYAQEMKIENRGYQKKKLEKVLESFTEKRVQKIVLMELFALIYSDEVYSRKEHKLIKKINRIFQFSPTEIALCQEWAKSALSLVKQGQLIMEL